ncbi:GNAT family N-acetyltransferase [Streptomyces litmocidini]|uniref:GNAT family N-acetyltransferase n=1 Tax=Streptomyces litmocidini TaxID=67318 RepID=A0ABW7UCL4_9ACTN
MSIREALPEDAAALAAVHVRSWRAAYRGLVPDPYLDALGTEERAGVWRARLVAPERPTVLVATGDDGRVVAFSCLRPRPDGTAELAALYALPEVWGTGVGRALMSASTEALVAAGFRAAVLWVFAGNARGRRFYEAAGWRADGAVVREETGGRVLEELRYRRDLLE